MATKEDKSNNKLKPKNSLSSEDKNEDRTPLPNKLKYITAAVIFYGNIAFVSKDLYL